MLRSLTVLGLLLAGSLVEPQPVAAPLDLARDFAMTVCDHEVGLADFALASVTQTSDGRLWYSSFGSLGCFDGMGFQGGSTDPTFVPADCWTLKVFTDRQGKLWAGARGRILHQDVRGWLIYDASDGVPPINIATFTTDPAGGLWAGGVGHIVRFETNRFVPIPVPQGPQEGYFLLATDTAGQVWCASGLYLGRYQTGQWTATLEFAQTRTNKIMGLTPARQTGLWVGFEHNIQLWRNESWTRTLPRPEAGRGDAVELIEDSRGNLWVGGWRTGLSVYNPQGEVSQATVRDGLPANSITGLHEDSEGNIWLSSNGGGLIRFRPKSVHVFGSEAGLMQIANSVAEESAGHLLVGTHGDGLMRWNSGKIERHELWPEQQYTAGTWVHAVLRDRSGAAWAGTYREALFRFASGRCEHVLPEQIGAPTVNALFEDREGRLWVGTVSGLAVRENGTFTRWGPETGLPHILVNGIAQDGTGDLWVCGNGSGLFRRHAGRFAPVSLPGIEPGTSILSLLGSRDGSLWIGTDQHGLVQVQGESTSVFGPAQGLPDMAIVAMIEDDAGDLWLGGAQEVIRIARDSLDRVARGAQPRIVCQVLDKSDGLTAPVRSGFQPVACRSADGRLWFATLRGLAVVDPHRIPPRLPPPQVTLHTVRLDGQPLDLGTDPGPLLQLSARRHQLEIRYSATRLGTPERIRFQRRLRPDAPWDELTRDRQAQLQDLRPGRYQFQVRAADTDDIWGAPASLAFEVTPFLWQRWWFRTAVLLALAGAAWRAHRWRMTTLERDHQVQAAFTRHLIGHEEQWRKKTAADLHDGLGQLLQVIRNRAVLAGHADPDRKVTEHVEAIAQSAAQAIDEMRAIVGDLHPAHLEHLGLTGSLRQLLNQTARASTIGWEQSIDRIDALLPAENEIHFYRIVQESVTNVVRHSQATRAGLTIRHHSDRIALEVWDNGAGLPASKPNSAPTAARPGLGLRSLRERAHILGGRCEFLPAPQGGLIVSVQIPILPPNHGPEDPNRHRR